MSFNVRLDEATFIRSPMARHSLPVKSAALDAVSDRFCALERRSEAAHLEIDWRRRRGDVERVAELERELAAVERETGTAWIDLAKLRSPE